MHLFCGVQKFDIFKLKFDIWTSFEPHQQWKQTPFNATELYVTINLASQQVLCCTGNKAALKQDQIPKLN